MTQYYIGVLVLTVVAVIAVFRFVNVYTTEPEKTCCEPKNKCLRGQLEEMFNIGDHDD